MIKLLLFFIFIMMISTGPEKSFYPNEVNGGEFVGPQSVTIDLGKSTEDSAPQLAATELPAQKKGEPNLAIVFQPAKGDEHAQLVIHRSIAIHPFRGARVHKQQPDENYPLFRAAVATDNEGSLMVVPSTTVRVRHYDPTTTRRYYEACYTQGNDGEAKLTLVKAIARKGPYIQGSIIARRSLTGMVYHPTFQNIEGLFENTFASNPVVQALANGNYINGHGPEPVTASTIIGGKLLPVRRK